MELATTKYRLVFLPEAEYQTILLGVPDEKRMAYGELMKIGIDNFHIAGSELIFIPDKYRETLRIKARNGESI